MSYPMTMASRVMFPSNSPSSWLPLTPGERWYVVRTQAQRELQATKQLENQEFRVFLPRHLKNRRHARRVETVSAPLFPQYLFTVLDLTKDRWRCINGTLGVDRVLICAGEPQPVPHGLIESLIQVADADGTICFDFQLREGQTIKVGAGPFADVIGRLEKLDDKGRVNVLLEMLGGTVRVTLPRLLVQPI
jgi:transcription elongation factor/antiterminator RfaH